ncbi:type Z 30S ribosomal protein S14 [Candidatus Beckwithbacteria bacterium CG22_combo_CG10-13_8_21_14_all_01_47_9]|uniref:Small ribosomal subunit protein uS14 n=5 Tax=Candidatus Beckwithiibacteriota TaxID=1752726 RepID=A0A2H0E0P7_9BACT|nr:MAG: 30S ribosomal protein S14 [Candidatus Beckwithbacteria bacterium CG1_02_47_37]PIP52428.1 MAG: type Z 30S ribosomal protein S14 [Candidatus Beckwithbacteria bacterium CG23_combo_of_CG06-09_8_20_14_all_47_9]PIP87995.1 MAG: type Z 30S ribosomal protein S14 [Candidatus Beckwithbacteria bacterium CG22_combo_CG10-13_8_21_14_all_01_47_9]PJC66514.1 MAG: type Z 30S ribosomal protein S14 [Candidatus Beckwithbacteria bacterium CG_4_9_14_0_2_um_filter_47_11]
MAKVKFWVKQSLPAKFSTRIHHRCRLCGRPRGYIRWFGLCRLCFRELAAKGELPGVTKASW